VCVRKCLCVITCVYVYVCADLNGPDALPGMGPFVSAFASSNLGDVSPNTMGAKCIDTGTYMHYSICVCSCAHVCVCVCVCLGLPCDGTTSTCNGRCENCIAFGPGPNGDMFESTRIIGDKQYQFAKKVRLLCVCVYVK
jgi:neutral ceramidase